MTSTVGRRTFHLGRRPDVVWQVALAVLGVLLVAGTVVALARTGIGHGSDDRASSGSMASSSSPSRLAAGATSTGASSVAGSGDLSSSGASSAGSSAAEPLAPPVSVPALQPKIVRTADLRLRVKDSFNAAVDRATGIATVAGGFVSASSTSSLERGRSSADLTLRVPADQFDQARRDLMKLGTLESLQMSGRDVGGQLVDLDARLRAARAEEDALTALLAKAGDIGQILQVRDRIAVVRTEIEQLDGEQAALRDQVAMSTIHVSLAESGAPAVRRTSSRRDHDATSIGDSARIALHAAEAVLGGMLIVLGAVVPLLLLGLVGWVVWLIVAGRRRRRSELAVEHTFG